MATATGSAENAFRRAEVAERAAARRTENAARIRREKIGNAEDAVRAAIRTAMQTEKFRGKKMQRRQSL